jgi:hypothetical protein
MYKLGNLTLRIGRSFTANGVTYPSNWLQKSTEAEKTAIGITWEDDPVRADDRFYWNGDINLPKAMEDTAEENGSTTVGLKTVHTQQVKQTANTLLNPTDWYITRKAEVGTEVPANVVTYRSAVRTECDRLEAAINAATSVEDLINILSTTNWPEL